MSIPVTVDFPVAFNAIRKNGRKEDVFMAQATVGVELETLTETQAPELLRIEYYGARVFRYDNEGRFFYQLSTTVPTTGTTFTAERREGITSPEPGNVRVEDLLPAFPRKQHAAVKKAYGSGDTWALPAFDAAAYKSVDLVAVEKQIEQRREVLSKYVVIGDRLHIQVEEPMLRMRLDGFTYVFPVNPWGDGLPYGCYSFAELDAAIDLASTFDRRFDGQALRQRIAIHDATALTPSFVERRIALLCAWFLKELPEFLVAIGWIDGGNFVAGLPERDRELLKALCDAASKTDRGTIDAAVLHAAEQLMDLAPGSQLRQVLDHIEDAPAIITALRAQWDARPVSINVWNPPA